MNTAARPDETSSRAVAIRSRLPGLALFGLMLLYGCVAVGTVGTAGLSMFVVDSCGTAGVRCDSDLIGAVLPAVLVSVAVISLLVFLGVLIGLARGRRVAWVPLAGMALLLAALLAQNVILALVMTPPA